MMTLTFDVTLFRQQFPVFANPTTFPDAMLQMYWDMATCQISNCNYGYLNGDCRQLALNLLTAHLTAISVLVANGQTPGIVTNATIDKISVALKAPETRNAWLWWLNTTPYGQQLLALLLAKGVGGFYVGGLPETTAFRKIGGIF